MFTFDDKVIALAMVRTLGFSRAVAVLARSRRVPAVTMREMIHELESKHYLLDDGVVEVTAGTLQYVEFNQSSQPIQLTQEYFDSRKPAKQEAFMEALAVLGAGGLLRKFKLFVPTKARTYATKSTG